MKCFLRKCLQESLFIGLTLVFLSTTSAQASAVISRQKQQQQQKRSSTYPAGQNQSVMDQEEMREDFRGPQSRESDYSAPITQEKLVDFKKVWEDLKVSSETWPLILNEGVKEQIVSRYIALYARQDVVIRKSPQFYAQMIDAMAQNNPDLMENPFREVLKFVTIMEYDFDNGQDKDLMALKLLGHKIYQENKARLGKTP